MARLTYYATTMADRPMIRPSNQPHSLGVALAPGPAETPTGVAFPCGPLLYHELDGIEVIWMVVVGGDAIPGWWALRYGTFVPIDAERVESAGRPP